MPEWALTTMMAVSTPCNAPIVWPVDGQSVAPRAAATPENQGWRVRLRADVAEGGAIDTEREIPVVVMSPA